ncbi:MAG TPA: DUF3443 domain-containing protein [Pseudomonadales bacterium]|nr:DUF3443 domain-containing protein [Pseudomonadales bacterium]
MQFNKLTGYLCFLLLVVSSLTGCPGGGGSKHNSSSTDNTADNELKISIADQVNIPYVSVTVCVPNTDICKTIDHVLLDTGSTGLRLMKSALTSTFTNQLSAVKDSTNHQLAECMQFADGYVWGPLYKADVKLAKEFASNIVMHVIDDTVWPVPSSCSEMTQNPENTPQSFGANGVLGVGSSKQDCGAYCAKSSLNVYYSCTQSSCTETTVDVTDQVHNPAVFFAANNNGVVISLPAISAAGQSNVTGSVIFGIGTAANNQLGNAKIFSIDENGMFITQYKNLIFDQSFMDTGSNGLYFEDSEIPLCTGQLDGFYCPDSTLALSATLTAANVANTTGATKTINFSIANTSKLSGTNAAFNNLGGTVPSTLSGMFDWGLPFFFGRTVYNAFDEANTSGGVGPYVAF